MTGGKQITPLEVGTKVMLSEKSLAIYSESERRKFEGRVGTITGYRMGARDPIVSFEQQGRFRAIRLYEVARSGLVIVP